MGKYLFCAGEEKIRLRKNFWSTEGKKEKETIILEKESITTDGHRQ